MDKNILLLQGPMGPFFKRLANDLEESGHIVYKINLNAGDYAFFRGKRGINYTGTIDEWAKFLKQILSELKINTIFLFGDQRPYHRVAMKVSQAFDIDVFVFEEGYLRPYYITIEKNGVNGHSCISRSPESYEDIDIKSSRSPLPIPYSFMYMAWYAAVYYTIGWLGHWRFPHYIHHRSFDPFLEGLIWLRAGFRKYYYRFQERGMLKKLATEYSKHFYLVPLQVHNDAQIKACSSVPSAAAFIRRVISSFSKYAPGDTLLLIKHHPLDRGYVDYTDLIDKIAHKYGCHERIIYIHDLHLPTLLHHARGTVLLNSTVGLSSLLHKTPVITLGRAIYDMAGLTYQEGLTSFWNSPGLVNRQLFLRFKTYLLENNQINGNFYRKSPGLKTHTGIDQHQFSKLTQTHKTLTTKLRGNQRVRKARHQHLTS